jgi:hypothetical protein
VLLADAVRFAREGYPVSASEARNLPNEAEGLRARRVLPKLS